MFNTRGTPLSDENQSESTGVGGSLTNAFVAQLEGEKDLEETEDSYLFSVTFARAEFNPDD